VLQIEWRRIGWAVVAVACIATGPPILVAQEGRSARVPEDSVAEQELEFGDGAARLHGTVFLPASPGPGPGAVILGGSDRGARGSGKRRLARHLAGLGVASLIYDSPGTGRSTGNALLQTREDRVQEALVAARFLRSRERLDPERVGLCGGSEGAGVALLAAARDARTAFVVAMSGGLGLAPLEIGRHRIETLGRERGLSAGDVARALVLQEILLAVMTGEDLADRQAVLAAVAPWNDERWESLVALAGGTQGDRSKQQIEDCLCSLRRLLTSWRAEPWFKVAVVDAGSFARFLALDAERFSALLTRTRTDYDDRQRNTAAWQELDRIRCPVLAVWGEKDRFVPPERSAAWLREHLSGSPDRDVTIAVVPGANHFLMLETAGASGGDRYPDLLGIWLRRQVHAHDRVAEPEEKARGK
jgi:pimeloyl-ACP methyl ester carboxylesterase